MSRVLDRRPLAVAGLACLVVASVGLLAVHFTPGQSVATEPSSSVAASATGGATAALNSTGTAAGSLASASAPSAASSAASASADPISNMAAALLALPEPAGAGSEDTSGDPQAADVVLIVDDDADTAGSVLDWEKVAAREFINDLRRSSIAILTTADPSGSTTSLAPPNPTLSQSLTRLKAAGSRDLVAALRRAGSILASRHDPSRKSLILLMAAGSGSASAADLAKAAGGTVGGPVTTASLGPGATGSAGTPSGPAFARLAIGRGSHEPVLFDAGPSTGFVAYQFAPSPSDIPLALDALRMQAARTELVFESKTAAWPASGPWSRPVAINEGLMSIRACATTTSSSVQLALIDPSGKRIDGSAKAGASVSRMAGRTCISVKNPTGGNWTVQVAGDAGARAWPLRAQVEAVPPDSGRSYFIARQLGKASWPVAITATYRDTIMSDGTVWFDTQVTPDECLRADFGAVGPTSSPAQTNVDGCSDQSELDTEVPTTITPGSYRIEVSVAFTLAAWNTDPSTVPAQKVERQAILSVYVPADADSDGDGLSDDFETTFGLNPHDPTDGLGDPDKDGLRTTTELTVTGTDPRARDTDGGGESDGDEVAAGKNPLDRSDDVRVASCVGGPQPWPTTRSYPPGQTLPSDPALEAALPRTMLDRPTTRVSVVGEAGLQDVYLGAMAKALELCAGKQDADVATGFAYVPNELDGWLVQAVKIRGLTGAQLEQYLLQVEPGSLDNTPPMVQTVAGKSYRIYNGHLPVYTTSDTIYLMFQLPGGDFAGPTPAHTPLDLRALFDDVVRQLP